MIKAYLKFNIITFTRFAKFFLHVMNLKILTYGNTTLKKISTPLESMTPELRRLVDQMAEIMYKNKGVGLASPQVGKLRQLVVLDVDQVRQPDNPNPERRLQVFINPEIRWESEEDNPYTEGCLSVPGVEGKVYRPSIVRVRFRDIQFKEREIEADGLLARVIQHEVDHLHGILFVDRLKFAQRALIAGKLSRLRKKNRAGLEEMTKETGDGLII